MRLGKKIHRIRKDENNKKKLFWIIRKSIKQYAWVQHQAHSLRHIDTAN